MIRFLDFVSFLLEWSYAFTVFYLLHTFLSLRENRLIRILAFVACHMFATVIIYSNDPVNLLGMLIGFAVYIAIFHRGHWLEKLSAVLIFYPAIIAVNYFMQDIGLEIFYTAFGLPKGESVDWNQKLLLASTAIHTFTLFLRLLFWLGTLFGLKKYLIKITFGLTAKMWLLVDILMLAPFIAIFTIICFLPKQPVLVYPICGASIFSSFGCIYLAAYICDSLQTIYRAQTLNMKQAYWDEKLHDEERVRSVYHDMKNHLLVLEHHLHSPETTEVVEKLQRQIEMYEDYVHTGNDILDIILKEKSKLAREKHIVFSAAADLNSMDFMEPLDISTIFGNSLDNAIEASEKLPEGQGAILLKAGRVQNFFSILVENNCSEDNKGNINRTTKKDGFLHGFGISNMKKTAEKYGGQLITQKKDGKFTLKILIPISSH